MAVVNGNGETMAMVRRWHGETMAMLHWPPHQPPHAACRTRRPYQIGLLQFQLLFLLKTGHRFQDLGEVSLVFGWVLEEQF
jgi:hypothetical protein